MADELRALFQRELPEYVRKHHEALSAALAQLVTARVQNALVETARDVRKAVATEISTMITAELAKPEYVKEKEVLAALTLVRKRVKDRFTLA